GIKNTLDTYVDSNNEISLTDKLTFKVNESMESGQEIIKRVMRFFKEVYEAHHGSAIFVVSHGNTMRTFLQYIGYAKPHQIPASSIENTGYFQVDFDGEKFRVTEVSGI